MYWHEFKHPSIEFVSDFRFLYVLGYDLILGLDWLSQLGPMRVYWVGKKVVSFLTRWQGSTTDEIAEIKVCEGIDLKRCIKSKQEMWVALIKAISDNSDQATVYRPEVEQLLNPFQDIFEEPTELPPKREIDHTIPLVPNAQPECSKLMVIVTMRRVIRWDFIMLPRDAGSNPALDFALSSLLFIVDATLRKCAGIGYQSI